MLQAARKAARIGQLLTLGQFGARCSHCPVCGPTILVKLANDAISVRCIRCSSSAIHMSIIKVIRELHPDLSRMAVYEMSSQGPLFEFLRRHAKDLTCSEYFDNVAPGEHRGRVQCQDVQRLTYPDAAFDLCTSTDVFEHVADDMKGFREICRVLRPGACFVLTVPLSDSSHTVERAEMVDGMILHHEAPEYHGDAIRGYGRVLCFRNYGRDITQRLIQCGFSTACIVPLQEPRWWGFGRNVIVADK